MKNIARNFQLQRDDRSDFNLEQKYNSKIKLGNFLGQGKKTKFLVSSFFVQISGCGVILGKISPQGLERGEKLL